MDVADCVREVSVAEWVTLTVNKLSFYSYKVDRIMISSHGYYKD